MIASDGFKRIMRIDLHTARKVAVFAQGLALQQASPPASLASIVGRLGCLQVDSIQAVRRSQEIVLLSRGVPRTEVDRLYTPEAGLYETWGHAHSLLPQSLWPIFRWRRERIRKNGLTGPTYNPKVGAQVLRRIQSDGPATHGMLGKTRGSGWERASEVKTACEWLLSFGDLVVVSRDDRWQRIYCTPDQANMPMSESLDVQESLLKTVDVAIEALGIATLRDIQDYFRFPKDLQISDYCLNTGFIPVQIEGMKDTWLVSERLLNAVDEHDWSSDKISILSPFDSLIWYRPRQLALFGKDYKLEVYKPAHKRDFGYFSMPILCNENIIGRVAARVKNSDVLIENIEIDEPYDLRSIVSEITRLLTLWTSPLQAA
ncbi:DNA glycosylase AlkZ-like family protein [Rothia sp. P7208]|uniref:DNA glycosylase AlkZ-like family protein n=1 Tax=Rothia sp. P7208 TaxID=3402660 RepID=UPI003AC00336